MCVSKSREIIGFNQKIPCGCLYVNKHSPHVMPPPLWGFSSDFSLGPLVGDPWVQGILGDFVTHKYPLF